MKLSPTSIFRIDGVGALVTALCIGVLMPAFPDIFKMPPDILNKLALVACLVSAYSLACSILKPKNWPLFLSIIALANLSYCIITAWMVFTHRSELGLFDFGYFVSEILILTALAIYELRFAKN